MHERIAALNAVGQSVWLDNLHRDLLDSGGLERLVELGVSGITANPTIFANAVRRHSAYRADIVRLAREGAEPIAIYERLISDDVRRACDLLRPLWQSRDGRDGFVSLEVAPSLADDTDATVAEAERLWRLVDRDNLMIKVPATPAGMPAIERLIDRGVAVNVTLIFSIGQYLDVADAYLRGLEARGRRGAALEIASVASFFVSRIDSAVDKELPPDSPLRGRIAVANAKLAYAEWQELCASERWRGLAARGARTQRLLWGSTGTKNPAYSDVLYVEELIGPETIDTMPDATLTAFLDHGRVRPSLAKDVDEARRVLADLAGAGIDLDAVCARLLVEGVRSFSASYDELVACITDEARPDVGAPA